MRTETEYLLMLHYVTAEHGSRSVQKRLDPGTTEAEALHMAREWLRLEHPPWRVEVFSREVPVDWQKVEELRG